MRGEKHAIKPLAHAVVVFVTLGITIANETLAQLGIEKNYILVFSMALILAALLLSRNLMLIAVVACGVIALNLPEPTLLRFGLDQDVLLAFVCAVILVPSLYELIVK
jgi:hypothetical protein